VRLRESKGKKRSMDQVERTHYEQQDPKHPTEQEFVDRATRALDEALRKITEFEQRMDRNVGRESR